MTQIARERLAQLDELGTMLTGEEEALAWCFTNCATVQFGSESAVVRVRWKITPRGTSQNIDAVGPNILIAVENLREKMNTRRITADQVIRRK